MNNLLEDEIKLVSGGYARMVGPCSMGPQGMTFQDGFYIEVTSKNAHVLNNFAAYSDRVVNLSTKEILFDGTQSSFCINGSMFRVSSIEGGHRYTYVKNC